MHDEALEIFPGVLDAIGFERGFLVGHSDGASIAVIYAGGVQDHRIRGLSLLAPHFVVEEVNLASIEKVKADYETGELRRSCRAGTTTWTAPSAAGARRGSRPRSATGTSRMRSPTSACPSRSSRAATLYGTCARSRSPRARAIAPWTSRYSPASGTRRTGKLPSRRSRR